MKPRRLAVLAVAALGGCTGGDTGTEPGLEASLAVTIAFAPGLAPDPDAGTLHLEGPTPRTVSISPGQTLTVDNLQPGGYTVSLEAFSAGRLELFAETTTTVIAGQNRQVSLTLRSFIPTNVVVPGEVDAGEPVTVTYGAVSGATSYVVQWADNPQFSNAQQQEVPGTSVTFAFEAEGEYQVRVFARNRFGSDGVPAAPSPVVAAPPPVALEDGVPLPDRAGDLASSTYYSFDVPSGPPNRVLQIRLRGGTGDADLAIRSGSRPTLTTFDCASISTPDLYHALDFCSVLSPEPGRWYIAIVGAEAYEAVTLDARILPLTALEPGVPITGLEGGASDVTYFEFGVPEGVAPPSGASAGSVVSGSSLLGSAKGGSLSGKNTWGPPPAVTSGPQPVAGTFHVTTSGGTGDVDLWGAPRPASPASLSSVFLTWPCSSWLETNDETCDVDDPDAGPWTVLLIGYEAYGGVRLAAEFVPPAPVISNPRYTVVAVNDPGLCSNGGTKIDVTVDYDDPNGDVGDPVPFTSDFTFSPSGSTGTSTQDVARNGTGDAGDVTAGYCVIFGGDTQVSLDITISDAAGLESNRVGLAIPKPSGANAPGATPVVGPAGSR